MREKLIMGYVAEKEDVVRDIFTSDATPALGYESSDC
jgi:hypothetical protein